MMRGATAKFTAFGLVMLVLSAFLFFIFGQYRTGPTDEYSAVFANVSRLRSGDSVRIAGIRVGTVGDVTLRADKTVLVRFEADRDVVMSIDTKAVVRYLNLVGDRYLELVDGPGSTRLLPAGSQIPVERTAPALDLDLLLGGLKPVIQGLNPQDVNALTASLLEVLQGQGDTMESLLSRTSSFTRSLADKSQTVEQLIDNLNVVVATLAKDGDKFSDAVDKLQRLIAELAHDRDPIGAAIDSLDMGTASLAGLLTNARAPLADTVEQLNRVAPLLDMDKDRLAVQIQKLPENYRKLVRLGAYGSFTLEYLCALSFRVTDLQGRTAEFPWFKQEGGRCEEP